MTTNPQSTPKQPTWPDTAPTDPLALDAGGFTSEQMQEYLTGCLLPYLDKQIADARRLAEVRYG